MSTKRTRRAQSLSYGDINIGRNHFAAPSGKHRGRVGECGMSRHLQCEKNSDGALTPHKFLYKFYSEQKSRFAKKTASKRLCFCGGCRPFIR